MRPRDVRTGTRVNAGRDAIVEGETHRHHRGVSFIQRSPPSSLLSVSEAAEASGSKFIDGRMFRVHDRNPPSVTNAGYASSRTTVSIDKCEDASSSGFHSNRRFAVGDASRPNPPFYTSVHRTYAGNDFLTT